MSSSGSFFPLTLQLEELTRPMRKNSHEKDYDEKKRLVLNVPDLNEVRKRQQER